MPEERSVEAGAWTADGGRLEARYVLALDSCHRRRPRPTGRPTSRTRFGSTTPSTSRRRAYRKMRLTVKRPPPPLPLHRERPINLRQHLRPAVAKSAVRGARGSSERDREHQNGGWRRTDAWLEMIPRGPVLPPSFFPFSLVFFLSLVPPPYPNLPRPRGYLSAVAAVDVRGSGSHFSRSRRHERVCSVDRDDPWKRPTLRSLHSTKGRKIWRPIAAADEDDGGDLDRSCGTRAGSVFAERSRQFPGTMWRLIKGITLVAYQVFDVRRSSEIIKKQTTLHHKAIWWRLKRLNKRQNELIDLIL